jgi:Beta/Gamma crystallin
VILFEHANFHGAHKHVFLPEPNLNDPNDSFFNDRVSSLAVLSGNWMFFKNSGFDGPYPQVAGKPPLVLGFDNSSQGLGGIPFVEFVGINNDDMSSLKPVSTEPNVPAPLMRHVILFEHANFHGAHKHVFREEPNLNAPDDNFFNDKVSSIAVLFGLWRFCSRANFEGIYPAQLGPGAGLPPSPGLTRFVEDVGIKNDDMSSLFPT